MYTHTKTYTDVGARPTAKMHNLAKYWKITRRTGYDMAPGQYVAHTVFHAGCTIKLEEIYVEDLAFETIETQFMKGVTRAFMFITRGQVGFSHSTGQDVADNGKLIVSQAFINGTVESKYNFRCPIRQKLFHKQFVMTNDNGTLAGGNASFVTNFDDIVADTNMRVYDVNDKGVVATTEIDVDA